MFIDSKIRLKKDTIFLDIEPNYDTIIAVVSNQIDIQQSDILKEFSHECNTEIN